VIAADKDRIAESWRGVNKRFDKVSGVWELRLVMQRLDSYSLDMPGVFLGILAERSMIGRHGLNPRDGFLLP